MVTEQQQQQQEEEEEVIGADDDMYYGDGSEADVDDLRMSGLSIQSSESDASIEPTSSDPKKMKNHKDSASSVDGDDDDEEEEEEVGAIAVRQYYHGDLSLPGSPAWSSPRRAVWLKEYASETEARAAPGGRKRGGGGSGESSYFWRNSRRARESRLERTWEMRRGHFSAGDRAYSHSAGSSPCVVVHPRGGRGGAASICMDMDEVRACRDLGLECDWTVEIPPAAFQPHPDTTGGGDSPVDGGRTSSPRDDQRGEVKARLRVWAQAVALASRLRS